MTETTLETENQQTDLKREAAEMNKAAEVPRMCTTEPAPKASWKNLRWDIIAFMALFHVGAVWALFHFTWDALVLCLVLHWLTGGIGITLTYHRLLTHRSFKVPKPLEYFLTIIANLAYEGGSFFWVASHRTHHAYSDTEKDPHSPRRGFFWAHMGWLFVNSHSINSDEGMGKMIPDLMKDPVHVFLNKIWWVWNVLLGIGLYSWGGLPYLTWGIFMRMVLVFHATWLVNSATHVWGYQTYKTGEDSQNLWWVAAISYGEGWHNNHHAFQTSARHGLKPWEIDTTWWVIRGLEKIGLATDVKIPSQHLLETAASR